ncbi:MAG: L,D-transpeptidase [Myxococcales bacterium]|nr:L,D-transpeptidase [Myxococcales bacterium]
MPGPREIPRLAIAFAALLACGPTGGGAEAQPRVASDEVTPASTLPHPEAPAEAGSDAGPETSESQGESGEASTAADAATTAGEEELEIVAPEDYGKVKFAGEPPPPEELTVHGLAGYEVVAIYSRPDINSDKLGYLRIGTRLMVTPKVEGSDGGECKKGFHGLPMGGYVCASKGFVVDPDKPPFMKYEPPKPRLDQAHPYEYGFVRRWNSPMWWRIPTPSEVKASEAQRLLRESERTGAPPPGAGGGDTDAGGADADAAGGDAAGGDAVDPADVKLPLALATPWLERGYFLSLGEKIREEGRSFFRTARGAFVDVTSISAYDAKDFQGVALGDEIAFPIAYTSKETKLLQLTDDDKLKAIKTLEKRTMVDVDEETEIGGKAYMITPEGHLIRKDHLLMPELQPLPKGIDPWERWIDVSISKQMLVAYEGTRPVYVTLVSTGKKGTKEEPFDTPTGRWRIYSKHISTTMDGNTASDGSYSIQDVPWTMFFYGSYALHGAFWHRSFGRVRSHGCVNLGPSDARWLFFWTTPFLPDGWHGVHATDESPGTTVIVRE